MQMSKHKPCEECTIKSVIVFDGEGELFTYKKTDQVNMMKASFLMVKSF